MIQANHIITAFTDRLRSPAQKAWATLALFYLPFLLLFHPQYDTNDDVRQTMIVSGVGIVDAPDSHILFPHIWIGEGLSSLYQIAPQIPWYGIHLYLCLAWAIWLLAYLFFKKAQSRHWGIWAVFLIWVLIPQMQFLQYTTTACLLAMAGWWGIWKGEKRAIEWVAILALLWASMVRWESLLLMTGLMVPVLIGEMIWAKKKAFWPFVWGGLALMIAFGVNQWNKQVYDRDPDWTNFYTQNALRAQLTDYNALPYAPETKVHYDQIGWTESAYKLYKSWFLADTVLFNSQNVQQLLSAPKPMLKKSSFSLQHLKNTFRQNILPLILLLPICWLMFLGKWSIDSKRKLGLSVIFSIAIVAYLFLYKWLHPRVLYPILGAFGYIVCLYWSKKEFRSPTLHRWAKYSLITLSLLYLLAASIRDYRACQRYDWAKSALTQLVSPTNSQKLYMIWADSFPYEYLIRPLSENRTLLENIPMTETGLTFYTPFYAQRAAQYELGDIHHALEGGDIRLIARPELMEIYKDFREDYALPTITWDTVLVDQRIFLYVWER